jgi:hypothetical protein
LESLFGTTHRQPVPYSYGLVPFLCVRLFKGLPGSYQGFTGEKPPGSTFPKSSTPDSVASRSRLTFFLTAISKNSRRKNSPVAGRGKPRENKKPPAVKLEVRGGMRQSAE